MRARARENACASLCLSKRPRDENVPRSDQKIANQRVGEPCGASTSNARRRTVNIFPRNRHHRRAGGAFGRGEERASVAGTRRWTARDVKILSSPLDKVDSRTSFARRALFAFASFASLDGALFSSSTGIISWRRVAITPPPPPRAISRTPCVSRVPPSRRVGSPPRVSTTPTPRAPPQSPPPAREVPKASSPTPPRDSNRRFRQIWNSNRRSPPRIRGTPRAREASPRTWDTETAARPRGV